MRRSLGVLVVIAALAPVAVRAQVDKVGHGKPKAPAAVHFAADFPVLQDHEWPDYRIGGFGGSVEDKELRHVPLILVHGNNVDAADWYPVRTVLRDNGFGDQEIFAPSYNGQGCNNGTALYTQNPEAAPDHQNCSSTVTGNDVNVPDVVDFIHAVQAYTGSRAFSIVGHSLGVTLARKAIKAGGLQDDVVAFVGIAGANHGTDFCPPGSEPYVMSCDEIAMGTPWLAELNGTDETPGATRYMTVYDGSGYGDPAYYTPVYAQSPALDGALNCQYPGFYHNDLRVDRRIALDYVHFLLAAERGEEFSCPDPPLPLPG
jgi:pimeloyl-ACP methyl ester carboxylesterase